MDVYQVINSRIMELLESGTVPWRKTWNAQSNYPKNLVSGKKYQGVNVFLLACQQYSSPWFLTFKQCQDKGGHVIKGSKSCPVIFWKMLDKNNKDPDEETTSNGKAFILKYYSVFNIEQTEGITSLPEPEETHNHFDPITKAEEIIANMPLLPEIKYGGNRAYYSPSLDYVQLSHQHTFDTIESFYDTLFHELSHSTGHSKRLGRKGVTEPSYFGSHEYSKEELIAQMSASFLCGHAGIETTIENSAAYIQGWLKALKNDKTLLIQSGGMAQKASDYILNVKPDVVEESA